MRAAVEMDHWGRQGGSSWGCSFSAGVGDTVRGGGGCDSGVDAGPELLPSCDAPGVVGDALGIGKYAGLFADCSDVSNASTASGVKSAILVKGRAYLSSGCGGNMTGYGGGGLADGAVAGDGSGVNGGSVRVDLAGGGCCGGRDCPVGRGGLGRG